MKTPFGYLIAFALQYIALMCLFFYVSCATAAGVGFFLFTISITEDIKNNFKSINKQVSKSMNDDKKNEILKQFLDTVQFHAIAKQLQQISIFSVFCLKNFPTCAIYLFIHCVFISDLSVEYQI